MKVVELIYEDPSHHPVVRFSCQTFSERGDQVWLLGRTPQPGRAIPQPDFGERTRVLTVGHGRRGVGDKVDFLRFALAARTLVRRERPDIIVCYNLLATVAGYWAERRDAQSRFVYHNLDLYEEERLGRIGRALQRYESKAARRADCVTASSAGRADYIKRAADLAQLPLVMRNCQRRSMSEPRTGELRRLLAERGLTFDKLIVRLGLLAPKNAVEATILAARGWPREWGLILAGAPTPGFLDTITTLVEQNRLGDRVVVLPFVPYELWYDILYSGHVGVALYEPHDLGNQTMAGAGNKLNLYLKAGIPSLLPDIPDFVEFSRVYGAGAVVNPTDPQAIAGSVRTMLGDARQYAEYCRRARSAFETVFNFEAQYAPVLQRVRAPAVGER